MILSELIASTPNVSACANSAPSECRPATQEWNYFRPISWVVRFDATSAMEEEHDQNRCISRADCQISRCRPSTSRSQPAMTKSEDDVTDYHGQLLEQLRHVEDNINKFAIQNYAASGAVVLAYLADKAPLWATI